MQTFNIHFAKTHLSRLLDEVEKGEPFLIAKAGKPKARVMPIDAPKKKAQRRIGFLKGAYRLPRNIEAIDKRMDREIEKLFSGKGRR
jgi:prevent-host-death family protein